MRVGIYTLGCKVNQYETQAMEQELLRRGHELVSFESVADAYIVNTCSVTAVSDKKSRQMIQRAHTLAPEALIAVVGCYAQRAPEDILRLPGVKLVLGTKDRKRIVELVERYEDTLPELSAAVADYESKVKAHLKRMGFVW